jgi:predicted nuclease of restriction endonuclease-like RecB superfamily
LLPRTLARLSTQVGRNQLVLHYLTEKDHPWLRALIDEYERGVGSKQSDLLTRLNEPLTPRAPKAKQRLAVDVLQRLTDARAEARVPPREARWAAFTAAAGGPASREEILGLAATQLGSDAMSVEAALFADLRSERTACPLPVGLSTERIAHEANLRLVNSWMHRARSVHITAWGNTRALVRQARLHGLICNIRRTAPTQTAALAPAATVGLDTLPPSLPEGIALEISGPLALFRHTLIYGRALGALIPRALWCHTFELRAECETGSANAVATLTVRSGDPLRVGRELAAYDSQLEQRFAKNFRKAAPDWNIVREPRPVESLGSLIFPDFELVHRRDPSRRWLLEIVGFWTPDYLQEKLRKLRAAQIENLLLCIDQERGCNDAELPKDARILRYKRRIDVHAVLAIVQPTQQASAASQK